MDSIEDRLASLSEIVRTARGIWLVHLGLAAYATIALSGVTDADFFSPARKTQLPIINFAVPTESFMLWAPLLLAIIHGYFHLYLSRLWREIGGLPLNEPGGRGWEQRAAPWIVAEMGFSWRPDATRSPVRPVAAFTVMLLGWWMPPLVAIAFVVRSFAAHSLTGSLVLSVIACTMIATSCVSTSLGHRAVQPAPTGNGALPRQTLWPGRLGMAAIAASAIALAVASWVQTRGAAPVADIGPYRSDLRRAEFAARPKGWAYWRDAEIIALAGHFSVSRQESTANIATYRQNPNAMRAFRSQRRLVFETAAKPSLNSVDLRQARMIFAFAPYIDFLFADLSAADLQWATLEGAVFRGANMRRADLDNAHLEAANFTAADMRGASLSKAWLIDTQFGRGRYIPGDRRAKRCTDLSGSAIHGTIVDNVDFSGAVLEGAYLKHTDLRHAKGLTQAQLDWTIGDETTLLPPGLHVPSCYIRLDPAIAADAASWSRSDASAFTARHGCSADNLLRWFPPRPRNEWPDLKPGTGQVCPAEQQ